MRQHITYGLLVAFIVCTSLLKPSSALAESDHSAVPGGIYLWPVPSQATNVRYEQRPVLIVNDTALVGISIKAAPGDHTLSYQQAGADQTHHFTVHPKQY